MEPYCDICEKFYSSRTSLHLHNKKYHSGDTVSKPIKKKKSKPDNRCKYCDKVFSTNSNMLRHSRKCDLNPSLIDKDEMKQVLALIKKIKEQKKLNKELKKNVELKKNSKKKEKSTQNKKEHKTIEKEETKEIYNITIVL